jgi:K+-transporting ATPase KdpC subunit
MRNVLKKYIGPAILSTVIFAVITGLFYPAFITGVAQMVFPHQANGSIIVHNETIIGSELIGQNFTQDKYFHGRPSAAGAGYDAMLSGGSDLGPSNPLLRQRIKTDINESHLSGETNKDGTVPIDAVTASGSGLDPDITLANALDQTSRVAKVRNLSEETLRGLIVQYVEGRDLGVFGEPRINVLKLNLALDTITIAPSIITNTFNYGNPQLFGIIQTVVIFVLLVITSYFLGTYLYNIVTGRPTKLTKRFERLESWFYRVLHIDPKEDMNWKTYVFCVLAFSFISFLFTYAILRVQGWLPLNPQGLANVKPDVAFNTAMSFGTNTNWQVYIGEQTMSYLSQMLALNFQNFLSAAVGIVVALALIRAITKRKKDKGLGNFWVDMTKIVFYVLIPICIIAALFFVSQGVPQTFNGPIHATTIEGTQQIIPIGPVASQEAIKEFGTNGDRKSVV